MKELDIFEIDKNRLDEEWVNQQRNYNKAAHDMADAREALERAKASEEVTNDELKFVEAEIELEIRKNPSKFDLEKVTEEAIKKTVIVQEKRTKALRETYKARSARIKAQHFYDICQADVFTLNNKKSAIESLVALDGRNYYSRPHVTGEDGERMKEMERKKNRSSRSVE